MNKFQILQKCHVTRELRNRVENVVLTCLDTAQAKFGVDKVTKTPEIRYNTKGKTAGWACWNHGKPYIDINPILLNENVEEVINQTVPHEVAHIVVSEVYESQQMVRVDIWSMRMVRSVQPHGWEWQSVMRLFGLDPERCHRMDVSTVRAIRNGGIEYVYKCSCMEHKMSKIKHNRMQRGRGYTCRRCRAKLVFDKVEKV